MKNLSSLPLAGALALAAFSAVPLPASAASVTPVANGALLTPIGWATRAEGKRHANDLPASYYGYDRAGPFEAYQGYGRPSYGYPGTTVPYGYGADYDDGSY